MRSSSPPEKEKEKLAIKTGDQPDISDIRFAWLTFLENVGISMSRLRNECLAQSQTIAAGQLDSAIDLTHTAIKETEKLQSKLMDIWGINRGSLSRWTNSGSDESKKNTAQKLNSTDSRSQGSRTGRTKKSRRK